MFFVYCMVFLVAVNLDTAFGGFCYFEKTLYARTYRHCGTWGWGRCTVYRPYTSYYQDCCSGWTGNGCSTPICNNPCRNGGICDGPDHCKCPSAFNDGEQCSTVFCSHVSPCYPGTCPDKENCNCFQGFTDSRSGCLAFSRQNNPPVIQECEVILATIRRSDKKEQFYFSVPCSEGGETLWCNQPLINYAKFTMKSQYPQIPNLPPPPHYVSSHGFGIVYNGIHVRHTKIPRTNDPNSRHDAFDTFYNCSDLSDISPKANVTFCEKVEENYITSVENGDIFTVTYLTKSGGYRQLYDQDNRKYLKEQIYRGQTSSKTVLFKFDLIAPTHCSERSSQVRCKNGEKPIDVGEDITKNPFPISWDGWSDSLAGIAYYYLEIFKLEPNIHGDLTELEPLKPIYTFKKNVTSMTNFPTYHPPRTGMYSILLQASDKANNSKIARRLVLFDNDSAITLTKPGFLDDKPMNMSDISVGDGGMHVISAIKETGYMWQTSKNGTKTRILLNWEGHFVNKIYDNDKLLNKVLKYPTQFANLQDDGILRSKKYVNLTDEEGARTRNAIPNIHGIVKFEMNRVFTDDRQVPVSGWSPLDLTEEFEMRETLGDGSHVRLWIRATDIMNHTLADYTEVHIDNTPPRVAYEKFSKNIENGTYAHTSRFTFDASDDASGVHRIEYILFVDNNTSEQGRGIIPANRNNASEACKTFPGCNCVLNACFLVPQTLDIDNCWFLVPKQDLNKSARIDVRVYNQALLYREFSKHIDALTDLKGLEEYSGPTNIRVEKNFASGVRLVWDLPKTASCYGRADIEVVLVNSDGSVRVVKVYNEGTSVDLVGLEQDQDYSISLKLGYKGTQLAALPYTFKTAPKENYLAGGAIAGIVVSVIVVIGILIAIFVVLLKRGHMKPIRRGLTAMSVKYRKSGGGARQAARNFYTMTAGNTNTESLYMYGEMDFKDIQTWQMKRDDVILESLLKSGSFADIYIAKLRSSNKTVVAKILKENFSENEQYLMKAKINFNAVEVGQHENVVHFIGAVVSETDIGPFIIYEYCSNGQMRDYLETMANNVTLETLEKQLRFGLGVARGMEYLTQRKIVHRRLAARNVLLDSDLTPKITGFGPQPEEKKDDDGNAKKRERIPLKWMAPECLKSTADATEKSDVWSFGIVLWEIFSFGESPYGSTRGRDLPAKLKSGYRLPKPEQCDDKWYGVMKQAWAEDPNKRPSFKQITNTLDEIFVSAPTDDYYYYRR